MNLMKNQNRIRNGIKYAISDITNSFLSEIFSKFGKTDRKKYEYKYYFIKA